MLGYIHNVLYDLLVETYGLEKWEDIRTEAGLSSDDADEFCDSENHGKVYEDELIWKILKIASRVLGATEDELMDAFGVKFAIVSLNDHRKMLSSLGCSLHTFLNNLDHMHQVYKDAKKFGGMQAPSFTCEPGDQTGRTLHLHYYSLRRGLETFVIGALRTVAKLVFDLTVVVELLNEYDPETGYVVFKLSSSDTILTTPTIKHAELSRQKSKHVKDLPIGMGTFCKAFPFHIIFDKNFEIVQLGSALVRLLGGHIVNGNRRLNDYFELIRPRIKWNFCTIQAQCNAAFLLHLSASIAEKIKRVLNLTGQMIDLPESECILYVGSPVVDNLEHLQKQGLYLSDIPIHDATRDLILVSEQAKAQGGLKKRLQSLKGKVQEASTDLSNEKKTTEDLLESIFPKEVAKQLIHKEHVPARTIESVTMLFSDLVGFTAICGKCAPMDVVNMLSALYTKFDTRCTELDLYKVETIGDAYVVAGGLDQSMTDHAHRIALMALSMMDSAARVVSPEQVPLQMRIGIHTGSVVSGVVGVKMPRYCLFGNNVTLANKMESGSEAGQINISPAAYQILKDYKDFAFKKREQTALPDAYPAIGDETCYFLTKKTSNGKNKITVKVTVTEQSAVTPVTCLSTEVSKKHNNSATAISPAGSPHSGKSKRRWESRFCSLT